MPLYTLRGPDGRTYDVRGPEGATLEELIAAVNRHLGVQPQAAPAPAAPEPVPSAGFSLSDAGTAFQQAAVGATKALTDIFGADNAASRRLGEISKGLQSQYTPERQAELQAQAARMKAAEQEGGLAEIKAAGQNIVEAPFQSLAQALGSAVPTLLTMFIPGGAVAKALGLAPRAAAAATSVMKSLPAVTGTAQGVGAVKGSIYDAVYEAERAEGADDATARAKAEAAQAYAGQNIDQILVGGGLGYAAGRFGLESLMGNAKRAGTKALGSMLTETGTEFLQGGQEQLAANLALQRAGRNVPLMQGVLGQATQEGALGLLGSGPFAAASAFTDARQEKAKDQAEEFRLAKEAERAQRAEAAQRAADEKAAEEARRQTPEYAKEFADQYEAQLAQLLELRKVPKPGKDATPEELYDYKQLAAQRAELNKWVNTNTPEYKRVKAVAERVAQERQQAAETETAGAQETQTVPYARTRQMPLPGMEEAAAPETPAAPEPVTPAQVQQLRALVDLRLDQAATAKKAGDTQAELRAIEQYKAARAQWDAAQKQLPAQPQAPDFAALTKERERILAQRAALDDSAYDPEKAERQLKRLAAIDEQLGQQRGLLDGVPMRPQQSESTQSFNTRMSAAELQAREADLKKAAKPQTPGGPDMGDYAASAQDLEEGIAREQAAQRAARTEEFAARGMGTTVVEQGVLPFDEAPARQQAPSRAQLLEQLAEARRNKDLPTAQRVIEQLRKQSAQYKPPATLASALYRYSLGTATKDDIKDALVKLSPQERARFAEALASSQTWLGESAQAAYQAAKEAGLDVSPPRGAATRELQPLLTQAEPAKQMEKAPGERPAPVERVPTAAAEYPQAKLDQLPEAEAFAKAQAAVQAAKEARDAVQQSRAYKRGTATSQVQFQEAKKAVAAAVRKATAAKNALAAAKKEALGQANQMQTAARAEKGAVLPGLAQAVAYAGQSADPQDVALIERIVGDIDNAQLDTVPRGVQEDLMEYAHGVRLRNPSPTLRQRLQIAAGELEREREQAKRSETEQKLVKKEGVAQKDGKTRTAFVPSGEVETAVQGLLELPTPEGEVDYTATIFDTFEQFDEYLASDAVQELRTALKQAFANAARARKQSLPLMAEHKKLKTLLEATLLMKSAELGPMEARAAQAEGKLDAARDKLQAQIDAVEAKLEPLRESLAKAQEKLKAALTKSWRAYDTITRNAAKFYKDERVIKASFDVYQAAREETTLFEQMADSNPPAPEYVQRARLTLDKAYKELADARAKYERPERWTASNQDLVRERAQDAVGKIVQLREAEAKWAAERASLDTRYKKATAKTLAAKKKLEALLQGPDKAALRAFERQDLVLHLRLDDAVRAANAQQEQVVQAQQALDNAKAELQDANYRRRIKYHQGRVAGAAQELEAARAEMAALEARYGEKVSQMTPRMQELREQIAALEQPVADAARRRMRANETAQRARDLEQGRQGTLERATAQEETLRAMENVRQASPGERVEFRDTAREKLARALEGLPEEIERLEADIADEALPESTRNARRRDLKKALFLRDIAEDVESGDPESIKSAIDRAQGKREELAEKYAKQNASYEEARAQAEALRKEHDKSKTPEAKKAWEAAGALRDNRRRERNQTRRDLVLYDQAVNALSSRPRRTPVLTAEQVRRDAALDVVPGTRLAPRIIGPTVRQASAAPGILRTGELGTAAERRTSPKRPITQGGARKGVTAKQAIEAAQADTEIEQLTLQIQDREALKEKAQAALAKAKTPDERNKFSEYVRRIQQVIDRLDMRRGELEAQAMEKDVDGRQGEVPTLDEDTLFQRATLDSQGPRLSEPVVEGQSASEALEQLKTRGSTPLARSLASRLQTLLANTKMLLVDDLRDDKGDPAYGMAKADGSSITLDREFGQNEQTLLHEAVHAASERLLALPEAQLSADQRAAKAELQSLYEAYLKDARAPSAAAKQSLSEFVAEALSDNVLQVHLQRTPWTLRNMWQGLKSALLRMLGIDTPKTMLEATLAASDRLFTKVARPTAETTQTLYRRKPEVSPEFTEVNDIVERAVGKRGSVLDRIKEYGSGLYFETTLIDRFAAWEKIAKYMPQLEGTQMLYYFRMYDQRMHFLQQALGTGALRRVEKTRADGSKEFLIESEPGANVRNVVEILKEAAPIIGSADAANNLFSLYRAGLRAQSMKDGFTKLNFSKVSEAEVRTVMAQVDANPELKDIFERAGQEYNEYNRGMLRFVRDTGALSKELVDKLIADENYIPYYRVDKGGSVMLDPLGEAPPVRIGNLKDQPYLKELVGGDTPIQDFVTSVVQNSNMLLDMGLRNLATKNAVYSLVDIGAATMTTAEISGPDVVHFKQDGDDMYARIESEELRVGDKTYSTSVPAKLMVDGLAGIPVQLTGLTRAMSVPSHVLRKAVTLNPLWPLRQLFRDSLAAPLVAGANMTPVWSAVKQFRSPNKEILERRGIVGGQVLVGGQEDVATILRDIMGGKTALAKGIAMMESFGMEADALTRRAQYASYINQGLSEMEATLMSLESMNFNKRGTAPSVHWLNAMIPFFNAQIQGLNVFYKALRGNFPAGDKLKIRQKLLARGAMLAGATMLYAAAMQDDEAYKNATPEQKYMNWFVRLPGVDEPLKLPIPYEVGYLFKALPEAIVNMAVAEQGTSDAADALVMILRNAIPGGSSYGLPQAIKPALEYGFGKSLFTGRDILSRREQEVEPQYQFRANTSEAAKYLGELTGVSPIMFEHVVRGYTSWMGPALLAMISVGVPTHESPDAAAKRLSERMIIGGGFQPNDAGWIANSTYERLDDVVKVKRSFDDLIKRGEHSRAMALLEKKSQEFAQAEMASSALADLRKFSQTEAAVRASAMDPETKREILQQLRRARTEYASALRGALD